MSYQAQADLVTNGNFTQRTIATATEQAEIFRSDARPDFVATANAVMRGDGDVSLAFTRIAAAAPGIADKVDNGDGTIDQSKVTDADLLSLTQANWQVVAGLYFAEDGTPLEKG